MNVIKIFLVDNSFTEHINDDGTIKVPLPEIVIQQLFAWLSVNVDIPKRARRQASANSAPVAVETNAANEED